MCRLPVLDSHDFETDVPERNSRGQRPANAARALALRNLLRFGSSPRIVAARRSPTPGMDTSNSRWPRNVGSSSMSDRICASISSICRSRKASVASIDSRTSSTSGPCNRFFLGYVYRRARRAGAPNAANADEFGLVVPTAEGAWRCKIEQSALRQPYRSLYERARSAQRHRRAPSGWSWPALPSRKCGLPGR